jgi:hypothetical protein
LIDFTKLPDFVIVSGKGGLCRASKQEVSGQMKGGKRRVGILTLALVLVCLSISLGTWVSNRQKEIGSVAWSPLFESRERHALTPMVGVKVQANIISRPTSLAALCEETSDPPCSEPLDTTAVVCHTVDPCELETSDTCETCECDKLDTIGPPCHTSEGCDIIVPTSDCDDTDTLDCDDVETKDCEAGTGQQEELLDYGDAPDHPEHPDDYPTRLASDGARHVLRDDFHLGKKVDDEADGQDSPRALGDDELDGNDDEDGVVFIKPLVRGEEATVMVIASAAGYLDAWIDFNVDRDWADPGEQIFASKKLSKGDNELVFKVPERAVAKGTFGRFRFSSAGGLSYTGAAEDGEVEDHFVVIK